MKQLVHLATKVLLVFFTFFLQVFGANAASPTVAASNLSFTAVQGSSFSLAFLKGNGENRLIVVCKDAPVSFVPVNGTSYTANDNISIDAPVISGEYVAYNGSGAGLTINGLTPNTTYHMAIFEYNGSGSATEYLATPLRGSQRSAAPPTVGATSMSALITNGNRLRLGFTSGNGAARLVLMRKGSPVDASPADLATYGLNTQIGTGNVVVYNNTGNVFDVTNLTTSSDYHFAIFEYNGSSRPVYQDIAPHRFNVMTNERPTVASSNFVVDSREGNQLGIRYKLGNGKARIIIARQGQPVSVLPVDGTNYVANSTFGGSGSSTLADGQYVVYNASHANESGSSSMSVQGLPRNTTYHFAIFEYDLDANGKPVYQTTGFATTSGTTYDEPTVPAQGLSFQNITDRDASFTYSPGNGTGRLVIGRRGAPVNVEPEDLKTYQPSANFGAGTAIGGDNFVISDGSNAANVTRMQSSTEYHFAVFEYNGYLGKLYLDATPARGTLVTAIRPTIAATNMQFRNIDGNSLKISWFNGNGRGRIIVARKGSAVTATSGATGDLKDNAVYEASAEFGQGHQVKPGEFVVYNDSTGTVGTSSSFTLGGLEPNTIYHFALYEYGRLNSTLQYANAAPASNGTLLMGNASTAKPPTIASKLMAFTNVSNRGMNLNWTAGNGEMRIVVAKAGSPVDATPETLSNYTANAIYGQGSEIGNKNFVVYKGTGNSVSLTGLQPGVVYHFTVYEANGNLAPVFQNPAVTPVYTESKATLEKPTVAASAITFTNTTATSFTINWNRGNGGKCLVLMKEGGNITTRPVDGEVYAANAVFGSGTDISTDGSKEYVVYNGTGNSVNITGLQPAGHYYVYVYEFEEPATIGTAYLTTTFTNSSKQIVAAPLVQATALTITPSGSGSVNLEWTAGSGKNRVLLVREGAAVNAVPADNVTYSASAQVGAGQQIGTGNYVVYNGTGTSTTIIGLKANRSYHFALFEYNPFNASPLYLTTNPARATTIVASPLPVNWISFTGTSKGGDVVLDWKTAAEVNNKRFELEKSANGNQFIKVGVVNAALTTQADKSYQFIDRQPGAGTFHYRLKQVDNDGAFSYSKVIQVKSGDDHGIRLMQNPVGSLLKLTCSDAYAGGRLAVADAGGRIVYTGTITTQILAIPVSHLPAGTYFVRAVQKSGQQSSSFSFLHQ